METAPDEREPGMNWSLERMIVPILSDFVLAYANFLQECARRKIIKRRKDEMDGSLRMGLGRRIFFLINETM